MERSILLKVVIELKTNSEEAESFFEWEMGISHSILKEEIDRFLIELKRELHVAAWQAYAAKANISKVKLFADGKFVISSIFLANNFAEIGLNDLKRLDSDIIRSMNLLADKVKGEIGYGIIGTDKFRGQ